MLYSFNRGYPKELPFRIRLSDGSTRTDPSTFTEEEISDAGYIPVLEPRELLPNEMLFWDNINLGWIYKIKSLEDIELERHNKMQLIRVQRNNMLAETDWVALSDCPLDEETKNSVFKYRQELRDITNTEDPDSIIWPINPLYK